MRFFSLEGIYPAVLRDDGKAFSWSNTREAWAEMSARELLADTRTPELTASEFETRLVVEGIEPNTLSKLDDSASSK